MNASTLLQLEFRRYWPNGTFRTLAVLYLVFFAGVAGLTHVIGDNFHMSMNGTQVNPAQDLFQYPKNWQLLAWLGSWFNVTLLGFLGVFMITLEFQHRTLRQGIIFGLTRGETAGGKTLFLLVLAVLATGLYLLLGILQGLVAGSVSLPPLASWTGFFLQALGYLALGTLAGLFIRQTALALISYLAYVMFLEAVVRWTFTLMVSPLRALLFLPDKTLEGLAPFPLPAAVSQAVESATRALPANLSPLESTLAALVYLALFAVLLQQFMRRADL